MSTSVAAAAIRTQSNMMNESQEAQDPIKRIGPLLNHMLEAAQRSDTQIPTDDYDLATYVHTHVDSSVSHDERRLLFQTLQQLLSQRGNAAKSPRSPSAVNSPADHMEVSATTISEAGGDLVPATLTMPDIEVLAATMFQLQGNVENNKPQQQHRGGANNNNQIVAAAESASKALVVVDEAEFERCSAVKPYVLTVATKRCANPDAEPKALPDFRFKIAAPLKKLNKSDPFFLYETAELYVEEGFHIMSTWSEAVDNFRAASLAFENALMFRMAANCMVRAHDVYKAISSFDRELLDDAAYALVAASRLHQKEVPPTQEARFSALACMQSGIAIFKDLGRERTTAKLLREAAELCILVNNAGLAVDMLHVATETCIKFGQLPDARACLARAAEIAVMDFSDFAEAVDTLEKMATVTPSTEVHLAYFRAIACRIVCVPPVPGVDTYEAIQDVKKTFDGYQDDCPSFCYGPEYKLIKSIISDGLVGMDEYATEASIAVYLQSHDSQIEEWLELVLRKIHKNIVNRKLAIDRSHTL